MAAYRTAGSTERQRDLSAKGILLIRGFAVYSGMRLCHFGDTHLGAGFSHPRRGDSGLTQRQEDVIATFVEAVDKIIAIHPDLCIHAGDLFDSVRPPNRIMAIAVEHLHRLAEKAGIPTVIISGNHDAAKQSHFGAPLEVFRQIDNLHIAAAGRREVFRIGKVSVQALPHCLTGSALTEELERFAPDGSARYNVFVGHGVAAGMPEFAMADLGEQEIAVEGLTGFDYIALGHYHNFRQVSERAWYCGSTERLSQAEREAQKGLIEVSLEPFRVVFHEVNARVMVDIEPIDATGRRGDQLAEVIREKIAAVGPADKIVRLRVEGVTEETLRTIPTEVITSLKQQAYALDLSFEKAPSTESDQVFGRAAIGRLDQEFLTFIKSVDLRGFDIERLRQEGLRYLSEEE